MAFESELLVNGSRDASQCIVLSHGAGAEMDSDFMNAFAGGLANRGHLVVRFEFPYMAERRANGKRRPPDREPVLRETWLKVIGSLNTDRALIILDFLSAHPVPRLPGPTPGCVTDLCAR